MGLIRREVCESRSNAAAKLEHLSYCQKWVGCVKIEDTQMDPDNKTRIMIVEDESVVAFDIDRSLHAMGYNVTSISGSGPEAIEQAARHQPDLALMDIRIQSATDGIDAAAELKERYGIP